MRADVSRQPSSLPDWSAVPSNSEGDQTLINRRIAYFGGVFFLLSLAFYVRNVGSIWLLEGKRPPFGAPALLLHLGAITVAGVQWLLWRRGKRTSMKLYLIDDGGL